MSGESHLGHSRGKQSSAFTSDKIHRTLRDISDQPQPDVLMSPTDVDLT